MDKQYTFKELIFVYMESLENRSWAAEELRSYYPALLAHLENFFQVKFDFKAIADFDKAVLFKLFESAVRSYKSIKTPWSDYLEATLLIRKVEDLGEAGKKIMSVSDEIYSLSKANKELHLEMIYELFVNIYGQTDVVVTSEQLRAVGFDDSKEPSPWDFE